MTQPYTASCPSSLLVIMLSVRCPMRLFGNSDHRNDDKLLQNNAVSEIDIYVVQGLRMEIKDETDEQLNRLLGLHVHAVSPNWN